MEGERIGIEREDVHFHSIQLLFLRNNLIDVWSEEWVGSRELCAKCALDGRLDLGLGARCDAGVVLALHSLRLVMMSLCAHSFLNMFAVLGYIWLELK